MPEAGLNSNLAGGGGGTNHPRWQVKLGQKRPIIHRSWQFPDSCDSLQRSQEKGVRLALWEGPDTPLPPNQPHGTRGGLQIAEITAQSDTITPSVWAGESQKRVREHRSSHEWRWVLTPSSFQTTELSVEARMDLCFHALKGVECSLRFF